MDPAEAVPFALALWRAVGSRWDAGMQAASPHITGAIAEGVRGGLLRAQWTDELLVQLLMPQPGETIPAKDRCRSADWQNLLLAVRDGSRDAAARLPEAFDQLRDCPELWDDASMLLCSCLPHRRHALLCWSEHLVGLLEQPHGVCVVAALIKLARTLPQRLYFAFHAHWPSPFEKHALARLPPTCAQAVQQLSELLRNPTLASIQIGMSYLRGCVSHLKEHIYRVCECLKADDRAAALAAYREMQCAILQPRQWHGGPDCRGEQLRGLVAHLLPRLDTLFGVEGAALQTAQYREFRRSAMCLMSVAQSWMPRETRAPVPLHRHSPILAAYRASADGALELPSGGEGQMVIERFGETMHYYASMEIPAQVELLCREPSAQPP
eukprot:6877662-Prymnesium_polylepis.1